MLHPKKRTVGVRIPDHRTTHALVEAMGEPLLSSTLLLPGDEEALTQGWEIKERLDHVLDAVLDSGDCGEVPTTVVDFSSGAAEVVRVGAGDPPGSSDAVRPVERGLLVRGLRAGLGGLDDPVRLVVGGLELLIREGELLHPLLDRLAVGLALRGVPGHLVTLADRHALQRKRQPKTVMSADPVLVIVTCGPRHQSELTTPICHVNRLVSTGSMGGRSPYAACQSHRGGQPPGLEDELGELGRLDPLEVHDDPAELTGDELGLEHVGPLGDQGDLLLTLLLQSGRRA